MRKIKKANIGLRFLRQNFSSLFERRLLKLRISEWTLIIIVTIYSVIFSYYTIMRHYSFRSNAWDLGLITQSVVSVTKGKLFINNAELYFSPTGSYFGVHFAPILFLMVPFFYLARGVETILILQSVVLALGAVPTYFFADYVLGDKISALFIAASYLLNPLLQGINWYDFHTQAFFPLFTLLATYFLKKERTLLYALFLLMALSTIEQAAYFILAYIPYLLFEIRGKLIEKFSFKVFMRLLLIPFITLVMSTTWIALSSTVKYAINPNPPPEIKAAYQFKFLGISDPAEIPIKLVSSPDSALKAIRYESPKKIFYIVLTFAPSCFLALLSPVALLPAFLWLLMASLSNWGPYYSLGFQYTAFTLPFITIATIETLKRFQPKNFNKEFTRVISRRLSAVILLAGIILSIFLSPLSFVHKVRDYEYFRDYGISVPSIADGQVRGIIAKIPEEAIILTTKTIFPHLSTNINAYTIPPLNNPSPELFESFIKYLKSSVRFNYILITYLWDMEEAKLIYNEFIKSSNEYGLLIKAPGLELYQRGYNDQPDRKSIKFSYKELFLSEDSIVLDDPGSQSGKILVIRASSSMKRVAWFGPYVTLLPGNYTVKFRIKVDNMGEGKIIDLDVYSKSKGRIVLCSVNSEEISEPFVWHIFSITFNMGERVEDVEFRGLNVGSNVSVCLDYIEVTPE